MLLLEAVAMFAATNIDDFVLLTLFFMLAGRDRRRVGQIVAGQFLGIGVLVAISLLAAWGLRLVAPQWAGLLGLVPLTLGIVGLVRQARRPGAPTPGDRPQSIGGVLGVTAATIASGGDNVATYTPAFRSMSPGAIAATIAVFAVLTASWLAVAAQVTRSATLMRRIARIRGWLVPAVLCLIGVTVIMRSGLLG